MIYSARDAASLDKLTELIQSHLFAQDVTNQYLIPFDKGQVVDFINRETSVENTDYTENGTLITTTVNPIQAGQLRDYLVEA